MYPLKKKVHRLSSSRITMMSMMIFWLTIAYSDAADTQCNQHNFSPCECIFYNSFDSYTVDCNQVPMADVAAIFQTKPALKIRQLNLNIRPEGDHIPADLLGPSQFQYSPVWETVSGFMYISGFYTNPPPWVTVVDPNAFRFPGQQNSTLFKFYLYYLDTSRLDLQFLAHVGRTVEEIQFSQLVNIEKTLPTLPYLPALTNLFFQECSGLNKIYSGSFLKCNGLESLITFSQYDDRKLTDEGISQMMDWLLPSSSNTLDSISLSGVNMTRTPLQLASFNSLRWVSLQENIGIMTVTAGTFYSKKIEYIDLSSVHFVEEGAFQGNYSMTREIRLNGNYNIGTGMTRFEAFAFKPLLEQMINARPIIGKLAFSGATFDCYTDPCHLAWITRDNRYFLTRLSGGFCNGSNEKFEEMSPYFFTDCPSDCSSK